MKKTALFLALLALLWTACRDRLEPEVSPCGYCPNNTVCIDDDCGCPPEMIDMGSWCMRRQDNLFIARDMLGCPCFEPFGLVLGNINPEQPGTIISTSLYSIEARETYNAGMQANFAYYKRSGGDSISIWSMVIPSPAFPNHCQITATQRCMLHLGGRFVGPDSIRATINWAFCTEPDNKPEPYHFWLVREP